MITIDYNPRDKILPIHESFLDKYLILCYTQYIGEGTLSYAIRRHNGRVCFSGISINGNHNEPKHISNPDEIPMIWHVQYNDISNNLLQLIENKWYYQSSYVHTIYVIKDISDLNAISNIYNLKNSKFLERLQNIIRK